MHIFLGDYAWGTQYCNGIAIDHNIFFNDTNGGSYNCIVFKGTNQGGGYVNKIDNNVFNLRGQGSVFYLADSPAPGCCNNVANGYFRNNIIYSSSPGNVSFYSRANNLYYNSSTSSSEPGKITSDPLLSDIANNIYTLRSNSPAINAGANLGYSQDFLGVAVPQGGLPDIGPYEFVSGVSSALSPPTSLTSTVK